MGMVLVPLAFFGFSASGLPVGFAIAVAGMIGILDRDPRFMTMAPDRLFAGLDLCAVLATAFFILAGEIMNKSAITMGLVKLADALVGWMRGGMAQSNMVAAVMFAGITGSATADGAAFGNTMVATMAKARYPRPYACAVTAAGSIIGPPMAPSTLAIT
jgi:TRAP-type C4-dicarboxylate transport system permease large subunit